MRKEKNTHYIYSSHLCIQNDNSLKICYICYVDSPTGDNTTPSKPVNSVFIYNLIGSKTITFWEGRVEPYIDKLNTYGKRVHLLTGNICN